MLLRSKTATIPCLNFSFIIFFSFLITFAIRPERVKSSSFVYKAPVYDLKNPNITFAMTGPTKKFNYNSDLIYGNMFAAVCQADKINQGIAGVNFRGNINLILQQFTSNQFTGQQATESLFMNNLYNISSGEAAYANYSLPIGGFMGFSGTGSLRINSAISNGFLFPFVFAGTENSQDPDNLFLGDFPAENITDYQIRDTLAYNSFNAVLDVLEYFNWTLVGTIFEDNTYGYRMQQYVQTYQSKNFYLNFACSELISQDISANINSAFNTYYNGFCSCLGDKDKISVVVLWMTMSLAIETIQSIHLTCSGSTKWTFIITNDVAFDLNNGYAINIVQNSLALRQFGPWNFSGFIDECLETASPTAKPILEQLNTDLYEGTYRCKLNTDGKLVAGELCPDEIKDRQNMTCFCTGNEVKDDSYSSNFFFSADAVTLYSQAMALLQNNCTFLNENLAESNTRKDYCAMTSFQPQDLSDVMRLVNFYGYSGFINFGNQNLQRLFKKFYLYSLPEGVSKAKLVGVLSAQSVQINETAISFVDGAVPVSMIVPQNPNLSYAVVDVFFAIAVFTLIISLIVLVLFIIYRNHPVIRRNAPYVTIFMIFGVIFGSITVILESMGSNDALCALDLYAFSGFYSLIIAGLIVKNYRIYKIFTNTGAQSIRISEVSLLLVMLVVVGYFWVLNTIAVAFGYGAQTLTIPSNPYYMYVNCVLPNSTWNSIFKRTLEVSIAILLLILLLFAWLTRKINDQYSESKEMAAFFALYFAIFIVFLPLYDTLDKETDSELFRYVIKAELILVGVLGALLILFIPKLYRIFRIKLKRRRRRED